MWWRRRASCSPLPVNAWLPALTQIHGAEQAQRLLAQAEARYRTLVAAQPAPEQRALRGHLLNHILPGLALYQVLLDTHGGDQQAALAEIAAAFRTWTEARNRATMRLLRVSPRPFAFFRLGFALRMTQFPKAGWDFAWIENSPQRIAFDSRSCFYLQTLTAYGAPELTASFCQMDDWMAEMLSPGITYRRTQTLARGGECCDFRYEVTKAPAAVAPPLDLELLACPRCRGRLALAGTSETGTLTCATCDRSYQISAGIPHFIEPEALTDLNRRFARLYDWFSWFYRLFSRVAFAYIGMPEEAARREVLDRLEPAGGRVLEVSIGPGVNLPYLVGRPDVGEVHGLDISLGQL